MLGSHLLLFVVPAWAEFSCFDAIDNDGDGALDCQDPDCVGDPQCADCTLTGDLDADGICDDRDPCPADHDPTLAADGIGLFGSMFQVEPSDTEGRSTVGAADCRWGGR